MNKNFSLYLDVVRVGAALGVLFSHFVMPRWTGGAFPDKVVNFIQHLGVDLVMVFFVLSGFVIAYTVEVKDRRWRDYAFNRATRMYSVALPAIIIAFFFDRAGASLNPEAYNGWWYVEQSLADMLLRGASFTNEFWFSPFRMGSNGPYWSLGYEVWYYVLFGFAVFLKGLTRIGAIIATLFLVGPGITLLGVIWIMGVFLYRRIGQVQPGESKGGGAMLVAGLAALLPLVFYLMLRLFDANDVLYETSEHIAAFLGVQTSIGRANLFLWHWMVGALVVIHFWGMAMLLRNVQWQPPRTVSYLIRWFAGASFSIYLIHYPVMQALDAALGGDAASFLRMLVLLVVTIMICLIFAGIFERPLPRLRKWVRIQARRLTPPLNP